MSTVQKLALGASLVSLTGVVLYESSQNALLRNQNAALRQQSEALVERIKVLETEHENATNMIATVGEENRLLQRDSAELARLRSEVTRLHIAMQQLPAAGQSSALEPAVSSEASAVAGLDEEQKKLLQDMTHGLQTGNSVSDIDRLKDSLARWDELFMKPAPEKTKPVLAILEERVRRRIAQLEEERRQNPP